MGQEFNTTILYIKKINERYFKALSAFHIFETLDLGAQLAKGQNTPLAKAV